jgi:hypothetical protein
MNIENLALSAIDCLLAQETVVVTHAMGWKREGFPLPIKRNAPNIDGTTTQEYRPMAILEFVQETLSGEIAARRMRDKHAETKAVGEAI